MDMHAPCPELNRDYFKNYAGSGKSYDQVWSRYSYADELIELISHLKLPLERPLLVLGAATGKVVERFDKKLGLKCEGCEVNAWAHGQISQPYRRRIRLMDMREYVIWCQERDKYFDIAFSNSLIYLSKREISKFLKELYQVTERIHFSSSFKGFACRDPYRKTLETFDWWDRNFQRAGFEQVKVRGKRRTYLWQKRP